MSAKTHFRYPTLMELLLALGLSGAVIAAETNVQPGLRNNVPAPSGTAVEQFTTKNTIPARSGSLPLPKEVLDRLSPAQIVKLTTIHETFSAPESVLLAPNIGLYSCIFLVAVVVAYGRSRRNRMLHETLRLLIEKGATIPPELLRPARNVRSPTGDLRVGLVFISVGIGVMTLLARHPLEDVPFLESATWEVGLIPLLMGIAFLIMWMVSRKNSGQVDK